MATKPDADKALWHEFVEGMKGRRFITWSKDLRKSFGLHASPEDKDIVEGDEHTPLVIIHAASVSELVRFPRRQAHYLHLLETGDFYEFLEILHDDGIGHSLTEQGYMLLHSEE